MNRLSLLLLASLLLTPLCAGAVDTVGTQPDLPPTAAPAPPTSDGPTAENTPTPPNDPDIKEVPVTDLWQRLRDGMALPEMDSPLVQSNEQWFASRPAYMAATLNRARLYLFHVVDEVDKRHLPMELALLPVIESSYNPQAESPSNASGIWQFLPSTGKLFGLKQNGWYDGRRDVVNATQAALDYLQRLYNMFNDWELAIAAYNCGEGCVSRAIAKNRARGLGTDFLSLDLPPQTRNYVPRLLAIRNVIREPERFGIALDTIPNAPSFRKVTLPYPIEAGTAARLAEMKLNEFLALNPGFRRRVIYAESQNTLLLPPEKVDVFNKNLADTESKSIRLHTYQATKGTLLRRIADKFDVTTQWLIDHNPLNLKRGKLTASQTLMLPPSASKPLPAAQPAAVAHADKPAAQTSPDKPVVLAKAEKAHAQAKKHPHSRLHTVRKGDTLYSLAKHYKVTVADILEVNGPLKTLRPGEKIHIPVEG